MSKVTIPMVARDLRAVSSLKELRDLQSKPGLLEKERAAREEIDQFQGRLDGWFQVVAHCDDQESDHASHQRGIIVLDAHKVATSDGVHAPWYADVTAELKLSSQGAVDSADVKVDDTSMKFHRKGQQAIYQETEGDYKTRLVIDHGRGTLTYEVT